jgi:hypothetical protein
LRRRDVDLKKGWVGGWVFQGKGREEKKVFEFWLFWPVFEDVFWFFGF